MSSSGTHLDPKHESMLPELLQKHSRLKVDVAEDGQRIEADCVYINSPNTDLALLNNRFQLLEPAEKDGLRLPIDFFLRTLAQDRGRDSAAVILSGTGSDGALGVKAIKEAGGLIVAQAPESAAYNGMPASVISTGLADLVLPPEEIPENLIAYFRRTIAQNTSTSGSDSEYDRNVGKIFILIRQQTGRDFSAYKKSTMQRRIERRMGVHQIDSINDYIKYLRKNDAELDLLFRELLIGVTSFFRDPEAFDSLKRAIKEMLAQKSQDNRHLRIWITGCATGEEAYSLTILARECLAGLDRDPQVQVFATDIDPRAVEIGREGLYPAGIAADVSTDRLKKYFIKEDQGYRIRKDIRENIVFSLQDVIKDPPFSRLDLLCCRNLLIYLKPEIQRKLLPLFHYTLNPGGLLFLGSSESLGRFSELFTAADAKWKIFRRREISPLARPQVDFPTGAKVGLRQSKIKTDETAPTRNDLRNTTREVMLTEYAPAGVVVDGNGRIEYVEGRTGKFLEPAPGPMSTNIIDMAREGLRLDLSLALRQAVQTGKKQIRPNLQVKTNGDRQAFNLEIRPLASDKRDGNLYLVVLVEAPAPPAGGKAGPKGKTIQEKTRLSELEQELQEARETHQTTVEELESSNEELKSTNEEMQSTNEELQSTNEELESSKEELQSLNEELSTVNSELQAKINELSKVHDDMTNLLNATRIATIFLNTDLTIRRFTPEATKIAHLIKGDIGRPLTHLTSTLDYGDLRRDLLEVLGNLNTKEIEVRAMDGASYLMRLVPYRTTDNVIDGVVISFIDISAFRESAQKAE